MTDDKHLLSLGKPVAEIMTPDHGWGSRSGLRTLLATVDSPRIPSSYRIVGLVCGSEWSFCGHVL